MKTAVLFGELTNISNYQIRSAIIRVPEVIKRIREMQLVIERQSGSLVDLFTCVSLENEEFSLLKTEKFLLSVAVQVGLFDRYIRRFGIPDLLVISKGGIQQIRVAVGDLSLNDFVSEIFLNGSFIQNPLVSNITILQSKGNYDLVRFSSGILEPVENSAQTLEELVAKLVEDIGISRIVKISLGDVSLDSQTVDPCFERLQISGSIEMDPMLNWLTSEISKISA